MATSPIIKSVKKFFKAGGKLLGKIICIFDDLPFVFKSLKGIKGLSKLLGKIGSYILAGAGFIVFPVEAWEGITGLRKAQRLEAGSSERWFHSVTNVSKIVLSTIGVAVSAALLGFTIVGMAALEAISSVLVPVTMAFITGVELIQKAVGYHRAKQASPALPGYQSNLLTHERKLGFGTTYFGFSLAVAGLATISTLGALGILTVGVVPAAILISVVCVALTVKIFEMVDKKFKNKFTKAIRNFFRGEEDDSEYVDSVVFTPNDIVQNAVDLNANDNLFENSALPKQSDEEQQDITNYPEINFKSVSSVLVTLPSLDEQAKQKESETKPLIIPSVPVAAHVSPRISSPGENSIFHHSSTYSSYSTDVRREYDVTGPAV